LKKLAIVTDFNAVSFREVSRDIALALKDKVKPTIYNWDVQTIPEKNILFVGNVFHLTINYCQRFLPRKNVIFYSITEGPPILDSASRNLAKQITFIAPSNYAKTCLETVGLDCEAVIPHGIDLHRTYDHEFLTHIKQRLPQPTKVEPSNIMLCVAGNWKRKALDKLLVAFKTVEKVVKDSFLILHSGIGHYNIINLYELLELKRFWFTNLWGVLPKTKLESLYALCDFYVQPSMSEGFGLTYLEAFKYDKPVIGVDCPATNEIVKDGYTGMLIPATKTENYVWQQRHAIRLHHFNLDDLIDAMIMLTEPKIRQQFIDNIQKEKQKYDFKKTYSKFLKYLE